MNNLALAAALATAPTSAFAELRERPRFWFPLLLLVATTFAINYWYFSMVDVEWFKDTMFGNNPVTNEAEHAAAMGIYHPYHAAVERWGRHHHRHAACLSGVGVVPVCWPPRSPNCHRGSSIGSPSPAGRRCRCF